MRTRSPPFTLALTLTPRPPPTPLPQLPLLRVAAEHAALTHEELRGLINTHCYPDSGGQAKRRWGGLSLATQLAKASVPTGGAGAAAAAAGASCCGAFAARAPPALEPASPDDVASSPPESPASFSSSAAGSSPDWLGPPDWLLDESSGHESPPRDSPSVRFGPGPSAADSSTPTAASATPTAASATPVAAAATPVAASATPVAASRTPSPDSLQPSSADAKARPRVGGEEETPPPPHASFTVGRYSLADSAGGLSVGSAAPQCGGSRAVSMVRQLAAMESTSSPGGAGADDGLSLFTSASAAASAIDAAARSPDGANASRGAGVPMRRASSYLSRGLSFDGSKPLPPSAAASTASCSPTSSLSSSASKPSSSTSTRTSSASSSSASASSSSSSMAVDSAPSILSLTPAARPPAARARGTPYPPPSDPPSSCATTASSLKTPSSSSLKTPSSRGSGGTASRVSFVDSALSHGSVRSKGSGSCRSGGSRGSAGSAGSSAGGSASGSDAADASSLGLGSAPVSDDSTAAVVPAGRRQGHVRWSSAKIVPGLVVAARRGEEAFHSKGALLKGRDGASAGQAGGGATILTPSTDPQAEGAAQRVVGRAERPISAGRHASFGSTMRSLNLDGAING